MKFQPISIKQVCIVPEYGHYVIEVIYEKQEKPKKKDPQCGENCPTCNKPTISIQDIEEICDGQTLTLDTQITPPPPNDSEYSYEWTLEG